MQVSGLFALANLPKLASLTYWYRTASHLLDVPGPNSELSDQFGLSLWKGIAREHKSTGKIGAILLVAIAVRCIYLSKLKWLISVICLTSGLLSLTERLKK